MTWKNVPHWVGAKGFALLLLLCAGLSLHAQEAGSASTPDTLPPGQLRYPIQDRYGDPLQNPNRNPFDLKPSNLTDSIAYDPVTKQYYIYEKIGNRWFRKPTYLTFEEFYRLRSRVNENAYFRERADALSLLNRRDYKPKFTAKEGLFNRLFGNSKIDIKPTGLVDLTAGYQGQVVKNPTLPERARRNGGFDFDMAANMNVSGSIGNKMKLPIQYNTLANFDFENQLKLDYTGEADEIIKKIELGNTSWQSQSSLIPGAQSLFGLKTQLQFGKLWVTAMFANQRSQRQQRQLQGGASNLRIELKADDYDENRHFLLAQHFRDNYNTAMSTLPIVRSQAQILRIEVWITNRTGATQDLRDVVGFMDLGEANPFLPQFGGTPGALPGNNANTLYAQLAGNPANRNPAQVVNNLSALGLTPVQDFEKTFARKLDSTQYTINRQIGFISLNAPLQPDEVLAVAYQYTYNGRVFQVGEFSQDVPVDSTSGVQKILFLKLLKATSARTQLPIWDLMMKNIYTLRSDDGNFLGYIDRADFNLNILYQEPGGGEKRYLPEGDQAGVPIITLLNLDRLNNQTDPQPDGVFDYLEGFTVISQRAQIIMPVLEPFGRDLESVFPDPALRDKYLYYPLYDTIKAIAQTYANLNRFIFRGTAKSTGLQSEIPLNAFNVPPGSVSVTAGGQLLKENVDYVIDYNLGTIKVINDALLRANIPINVQFENNATFGIQQRNFMGLRLDYMFSKKLTIGATGVRLSERPFFTKMGYGEDPIRNTMLGVDFSYRSDIPRLTRWLDRLPFYNANGMSSITAFGEAAKMIPGHPPQIGEGGNGVIYIDDFEGSKASIDLRFPAVAWTLASTPARSTDDNGNILFPEAELFNTKEYGRNRARLAWYNIEPILQERNNPRNPIKDNALELSDPRVRSVSNAELFPRRTPEFGQNALVSFDLAFYPKERGPYNYEVNPATLDNNGRFTNPRQRWGGIMRAIDQSDFETANIEFLEFWILDPFIRFTNPAGGKLYFNLGNISEDVLKDSRRFYENGLPTPKIPARVDSSEWGYVPLNPIQITPAFSNDPADREFQDVGFDGFTDDLERTNLNDYLGNLQAVIGTGSEAFRRAQEDPSGDNFRFYRDPFYDQGNTGILGRYKYFNNPHGNSPATNTDPEFPNASSLYPDNEDLNRDNSLNEVEEYFQYKVELKPANDPIMQVGQNFIVDKKVVNVSNPDGTREDQVWYQFRIPINAYQTKVGNIPDFKSIRFFRMFLNDFEDSTVIRFAKLELVRNQWRRFAFNLDTTGNYTPVSAASPTFFNVTAVNIEENDKRVPIPYRIPPGIQRVQSLSSGGINLQLNEQAMSMQITDLEDGDSRGVFKTFNLDLRQYKRLKMFVHAESYPGRPALRDTQAVAVIRIGNDFINNYYEIRVKLKVTDPSATTDVDIWPIENELDIDLTELVRLKTRRNLTLQNPNSMYGEMVGNVRYSIFGNPNLGEVKGMLVSILNEDERDIGRGPLSGEFWINELRLAQLDEEGGWAALGRVDVTLADLGTVTFSANAHSAGFGTLEQRVNERYRDNFVQFDLATNLQLGKLLPRKWGIEIPFYASLSKTISTPEYDPYDMDVKLKDKLNSASGNAKDSIRTEAQDVVTIKTINFTNVRKAQPEGKRKRIWSVSNLDFSYSFTSTEAFNPLIENNEVRKHRGGIGYNYTGEAKYWEPMKKLKMKGRWLDWLKDFNVNYVPQLLSVRWDINRQFGALRPREVRVPGVPPGPYKIPETYDKYFTFDRIYNMRWDLTRSLNVDFKATNSSRIDEPFGRIDTKAEKDSVRKNLFKGGRNTLYRQTADFTYNVPVNKIPYLDFIQLSLLYKTAYSWIGASRLAISLGNSIQNSNEKSITGNFNMTTLYNKSKWLQKVDQPKPRRDTAQRNAQRRGTKADSTNLAKRKPAPKQEEPTMSGLARAAGKILTMLKTVNLTYSELSTTFLPGFMDSTRVLGNNWKSMAPGMGFVLGMQPDSNWLNRAAEKGWITRDPIFNTLFRQTYEQRFNLNLQLQPVQDLTVDINLDKTLIKDYTELFKDTTGFSGVKHLNPYAGGGFSMTYISFQTLFRKFDPNVVSETFKQFEQNRIIISERLGTKNPYSQQPGADGYYRGYGRYAHDVLIPAFLAAYTNQDARSVKLLSTGGAYVKSNPFSGYIPKPNWTITYNGLTRIPGMEKWFTNFSLRHGYNSRLSMNSFNSALLYQDSLFFGWPSFIDTLSNNFVPYFLVPNITIQEQFSPLVGIDFTLTNQFNAKFEYTKSRLLSLSLIDFQLAEQRSTQFTIGMGYRRRGFPLPFKIKFGKGEPKNELSNDITFRFDLTIRDDANSNSRLDQSNAFATGGQKVVTIDPSIDYVASDRVNLKLFFSQQRITPYVSTSAPQINTRAGLKVTISLAQ